MRGLLARLAWLTLGACSADAPTTDQGAPGGSSLAGAAGQGAAGLGAQGGFSGAGAQGGGVSGQGGAGAMGGAAAGGQAGAVAAGHGGLAGTHAGATPQAGQAGEAGAGGEAGASGEAGAGGAAGSPSPDCQAFTFHGAYGLKGRSLWRDAWGFHAFSEFGASGQPDRFALHTLSPETGELVVERGYDVVPKEATGSFFGIEDVADDGQGRFAVVFLWRFVSENITHTRILFGSVDSDVFLTVDDPCGKEGECFAQTVSWVGKSFLVQMVTPSGSQSRPFLYSPQGQLLQQAAPSSIALPIDWTDSDKRVDPVTHDIWMAGTAYPAPRLWGLHSDGSPFPQPSPDSFFLADYLPCSDSLGRFVSLAPAADQALVVWKGDNRLCAQVVGSDLQSQGPALPIEVAGPNPKKKIFYQRSTAQRVGEQWWVAGHEHRGIRSIWLKDGAVVSNEPLVVHSPALCLADSSCGAGVSEEPLDFDGRLLTPIVWENELWLGYLDLSGYIKEQRDSYRIVRVAPGCVYPSAYDALP